MQTTPHPDILATAVLIADARRVTRYLNPAAENLLGVSSHHALGKPVSLLFGECTELVRALDNALSEGASYTEHDLNLPVNGHAVVLSVTVSPLDEAEGAAVIELHPAAGSVLEEARVGDVHASGISNATVDDRNLAMVAQVQADEEGP